MTHATITLRKATSKDAADLALLDDIAGNRLPSWLWQGAVNSGKGEMAFDFGRSRMAREDVYAWPSSWIAESELFIVGKVTSYRLGSNADLETDIPVLKPIFELMKQAKGSWYIDALAVYPEFRGKGIGKLLLSQAIKLAKEDGTNQISLIVSSKNKKAQGLYLSNGFEKMNGLPAIGFDGAARTDETHYLMKRSL